MATLARLIALSLAVLLASGASLVTIAAWDLGSSMKAGVHMAQLPGHTRTPVENVGAITGGVNLLLTGTDTRTGQGDAFSNKIELSGSSGVGSNDVTMLIHIARNHHSATVVSFPRDLMIPIPACPRPGGGTTPATSSAMLNTALSRGGLGCVKLTIEQLTGVQIPFAAEISFDGVIAMSNAVGGVQVCLATPVNDRRTNPPLHLTAGRHTIVGPIALSFLRSRHGVGDGSDLGRISNQQVFMAALTRKIVSGGILDNPLSLYPLAKAAVSHMILSDTLSNPTTMVQIALALKDTGLGNMVFLQYPTVSDPYDVNRVIPESHAARILTAALVADRPVKLSGATGRAAVVDPTTPPVGPSPVPAGTPAPWGTPTPTATAPPAPTAPPAVLPNTVSGQTAAQLTCTKGS